MRSLDRAFVQFLHWEAPRYDKAFMDWAKEYTGYSLKKFKGKPGPMQEHIVVLQKSHRFGEKSGIGALARAVNAGDARKSMGLFQKDGGERTDIKRMILESLEVKAFQRLVLDGLDNGGAVVVAGGTDAQKGGISDAFVDISKNGGTGVSGEVSPLDSLEKRSHSREGKSSSFNPTKGRGDGKAHFTDKSKTFEKKGGYRVYLEAVAASPLQRGAVTEES